MAVIKFGGCRFPRCLRPKIFSILILVSMLPILFVLVAGIFRLWAPVFGTPVPGADTQPIVDLGYSQYEGTTLSSGVNQFLGMRYAAPPLGDLRFRTPADPLSTTGIQSAKTVNISHFIQVYTLISPVPTHMPRNQRLAPIHHSSRGLPLHFCLRPHKRNSHLKPARLVLHSRRRLHHQRKCQLQRLHRRRRLWFR